MDMVLSPFIWYFMRLGENDIMEIEEDGNK